MFKCYVVLYTCASTRGVVLDLIHNETAKTFFNSLTRFIARRGCPAVVLSDNDAFFVATETQQFVASKNIECRFNLASAPWYGGFWERLVSSVKRCLKRSAVARSKLLGGLSVPQANVFWGSLDWLKLPLPVLVLSLCSSSFLVFRWTEN